MIFSNESSTFISRQDGESIEEYTDRLSVNKDIYGLKWDNVAALVNAEAGTNYSGDKYRKSYSRKMASGEITPEEIPEAFDDGDITSDDLLYQLQKARVQMRDERTALNAMYRRLSREDTLKEIAADFADKMSAKKLLPTFNAPLISKGNKTAVLNTGDWHYGLLVDNYWNTFNVDICKERIRRMIDQTIYYCERNGVTNLIVNGLGDYISGFIHLQLRIYSQEDVISQTEDVTEIFAEMLTEFSEHFNVTFHSVFGNHSRLNANKSESIDLENLERIIPWALMRRQGIADNARITIVEDKIVDNDFSLFNAGKWQFAAVHGDKDRVNNVVKNLTLMTDRKFHCIITAHKHHLSADEQNGCIVVANPSLIGVDDYSKNLRLTSSPAQTLIMVGEFTPVECIYYLNLSE